MSSQNRVTICRRFQRRRRRGDSVAAIRRRFVKVLVVVVVAAFVCGAIALGPALMIRILPTASAATTREHARRSPKRPDDSTLAAFSALDFMTLKCGWTPGSPNRNRHPRRRNSPNKSVAEEDDAVSCWVYTGSLYDPLTNREICKVQGLELVQGLAYFSQADDRQKNDPEQTEQCMLDRFRRRCRLVPPRKDNNVPSNRFESDSALATIRTTTTTIPPLRDCATMLSRKIFCYTEIGQERKDVTGLPFIARLLPSWRQRPNGPATQIPFDQAVTVWDTSVSCFANDNHRRSDAAHDDSHSNHQQQPTFALHTELFPKGHQHWSKAMFRSSDTSNTPRRSQQPPDATIATASPVDFSCVPLLPSQEISLWQAVHNGVLPDPTSNQSSPPPRSSLVQLGGGSSRDRPKSRPARESYVYHIAPRHREQQPKKRQQSGGKTVDETSPVVTMRYTRYGEGPVWYGPGRYCQLELTGERLWTTATAHQHNSNEPSTTIKHHGLEAANVQRLIALHVPVVAGVIQQGFPNFWKFGVPQRTKQNQQHGFHRLLHRYSPGSKRNDPVFAYYANALHPALLPLEDSSTDTTTGGDLSYANYKRFYRDLAVGRIVDRFRGSPSLFNDDGSIDAVSRARRVPNGRFVPIKNWGAPAKLCWDKIRAATIIS